MAERLTVNNFTLNKTCVTWKVLDNFSSPTISLASPPFALKTDAHLILFALAIEWDGKYRMTIKPNIPGAGRAILRLSVHFPEGPVLVHSHLTEDWREAYVFDFKGSEPVSCYATVGLFSHRVLTLTVMCEITWLGFRDCPATLNTPYFLEESCLPKLMHANEGSPDVKLIVKGKELLVHKTILILHSPVFLGMFETPMKESKDNEVIIEDIEFSTMETLIKIIYSGDTEDLEDTQKAVEVMVAAEKYQMMTIKTACERKLELKVTEANVLELLNYGDMYNAAGLISICIEYIVAVKHVMSKKELQEMCMKKPNLGAAFISSFMNNIWAIPCSRASLSKLPTYGKHDF